MPHAKDPFEEQDAADERLIKDILDAQSSQNYDLGVHRDLEAGEKAEDAVNYEDISDDDLADEEPGYSGKAGTGDDLFDGDFGDVNPAAPSDELQDFMQENGAGDDIDDLFGGDIRTSPTGYAGERITDGIGLDIGNDYQFSVNNPQGDDQEGVTTRPQDFATDLPLQEEPISKTELLQRQLIAAARYRQGYVVDDFIPPPAQSQEELLDSLWPNFDRNEIPRFLEILPYKKARWIGKTPLRVPKPIHTTKVTLQLVEDQEKSFRLNLPAKRRDSEEEEHSDIIRIVSQEKRSDENDESDGGSDFENEPVGGTSWQDFQMVCTDWDNMLSPTTVLESVTPRKRSPAIDDDLFGDVVVRSPKRRRLREIDTNIPKLSHFALPSLKDIESSLEKVASRVVLDLNDPELLTDDVPFTTQAESVAVPPKTRKIGPKGLAARYHISNDDAYELLKENHRDKIRSNLANLTLHHAMPALRLQWPYYKTRMSKQEARACRRPESAFSTANLSFEKLKVIKKKHVRGTDVKELLKYAKDVSASDTSHCLLLEYSEEFPMMLSSFGMNSRVINYYRKKTKDDPTRPKLDIGEASVLLPEDKSPFSIFGHVDAGETTPAIFNSMYKAPLFEHSTKLTDFLMIRSGTGVDGSTWYLKNIDYVRTVGQQFPSIEVPGPHSRKVTTASKNRLKMISYRIMRHSKSQRVSVGDITDHFPDSSDMQNRQKMKEFMSFNKEHKEWEMANAAPVPDENTIRSLVTPEEVCLLEAMQVGQQHLEDAGLGQDGIDSEDDDQDKEGQSIERQLAPWVTSKNFLNASAGKAMLRLHGEGDPSSRGEAFSFLKTSMKGGFRAIGESIEDKLESKKSKELGGHSYNVARQQRQYEESIRKIWESQKAALSSNVEPSDVEMDDEEDEQSPADFVPRSNTPRSGMQTPSFSRHIRDDETTSAFSKHSQDSQAGRHLVITRQIKNSYGQLETREEHVTDPRVIRMYRRRRKQIEDAEFDLNNVGKSGDTRRNDWEQKKINEELRRLEKNKERRLARWKQKGIARGDGQGSPGPDEEGAQREGSGAGKGGTGTQRKCANCGQVGHIKTNKKLCPLLNGTMKAEDQGFGEGMGNAFSMSTPSL